MQLTGSSQVSRAGQVGHLPGNGGVSPLHPGREHLCDGGALLPPPWGALGLWPSPQGTLNPHPHLASFQLPTRACPHPPPASLGCAVFPGPYPTTHMCAQSSQLSTSLCCHSPLTCVCPGLTCMPSSLPAQLWVRTCQPASGTFCSHCRRVGLFFPVCFGFRKKKYIPKWAPPWAIFPSFFCPGVDKGNFIVCFKFICS